MSDITLKNGDALTFLKEMERKFIGFEIDTERYREVGIRVSLSIGNFEEEV